jgi:RecA-family ATPase
MNVEQKFRRFKPIDSVADLRKKLRATGYSPIPIESNTKHPPLEKGMQGWPTKIDVSDQEIELWSELYPSATGSGLIAQNTPAFDLDIQNEAAAEAAEEMVRRHFEDRGRVLVRIGQAPKRAIPFRTVNPFKKITVNLIAGNGGSGEKLEFLGDGQQLVAFGIHPGTGEPYRWHGGEPGEVQHRELPHISEDEARQLIEDAAEMLCRDFGYQRAAERPSKGNGDSASGGAADWAFLTKNIYKGHELHASLVALSAKLVASGMSGGAAVNHLRGLMENTEPHDRRWLERYDDIPRLVESAEAKQTQSPEGTDQLPLFIDMSKWDEGLPPAREWAVQDRFPLRQAALFSGEGAVGKSIVLLHLCAAHALGRDWLYTMPMPGPALFVDAEDETAELHRRLANIVDHYGNKFTDAKQLHMMSLAGQDAVLAAPNRAGRIEPTALFGRFLQAAADLKPKMIGIASSANVYAGSEIDRPQVQQFVSLLTKLAIAANGTVVLVSHPSLTGINTNTGLSGSTAWHNSVRARCYMKSIKPEEGQQPDTDLREIMFKKNQYGPVSANIVLRYQNGLFLPVAEMSSLDQAARDEKVDDVFLKVLKHLTQQGQDLGPNKTASNYAPVVIVRHPEARGIRKDELEAAQQRLLDKNQIHIATEGPESKRRKYLKPGPAAAPSLL